MSRLKKNRKKSDILEHVNRLNIFSKGSITKQAKDQVIVLKRVARSPGSGPINTSMMLNNSAIEMNNNTLDNETMEEPTNATGKIC